MTTKYTVAIVGRPNVGKSTLFNRLVEERKAIVDDMSGVTRDRQYGIAEWAGKSFNVVDTGGFVPNSDDIFEKAIAEQVVIALNEADVILFVVDCMTGITDYDQHFAQLLYKIKKPILLVVNKVDNASRLVDASEFYGLGFEQIYPLSSISGSGTGELLDVLVNHLPEDANDEIFDDKVPKIAIIGQPNVGKSSLLNALVGENRNIVSDIPGTTRDTIHTFYNKYHKSFYLIDTAGLRKKSKVHEDLEFYSVIRAIKAMDESDICILMIDATQELGSQDINIFSLAMRKGKGVVVLVNKWDLVEKETNTAKQFEERIKRKIAPMTDVPVIFTSVIDKTRIFKALDEALDVYDRKFQKIKTSVLNEYLEECLRKYQPPLVRGHQSKINYITQLPTATPSFAFYCNNPDYIREPYKNYLENQFRERFNFTGVPIRFYFRKK